MERRDFLRNASAAGALGVAGLAGCLADADDGSGDDGADPDETADDTPAPLTVVDSTVETTGSECNDGRDSSASVSMDEETTTVSFTGQVTTGDPCHTVTKDRVEYDADADRLELVVGTEAGDGPCMDCVGLVTFEGSVELDGGLPGAVQVKNDDVLLTASGDESDSGADDSGDDESAGSEPVAVELVDKSFSVTGETSGAGSEAGTADVEFDSEANAVVVTGTIIGNNGCATAQLGSASYDPDEDTLTVDVETTARDGSEDKMCTQALVGIDYEATFSFEGGVAHSASVSHNGEGVASAAFDSAAASAPEDE